MAAENRRLDGFGEKASTRSPESDASRARSSLRSIDRPATRSPVPVNGWTRQPAGNGKTIGRSTRIEPSTNKVKGPASDSTATSSLLSRLRVLRQSDVDRLVSRGEALPFDPTTSLVQKSCRPRRSNEQTAEGNVKGRASHRAVCPSGPFDVRCSTRLETRRRKRS
jgi:hypothetical protein